MDSKVEEGSMRIQNLTFLVRQSLCNQVTITYAIYYFNYMTISAPKRHNSNIYGTCRYSLSSFLMNSLYFL